MNAGLAPLAVTYLALSFQANEYEPVKFVLENDYERMCIEHLMTDGQDKISTIQANRMTGSDYCECVYKTTRSGIWSTINKQRAQGYSEPREAVRDNEMAKAYDECLIPPDSSPSGENR